MSDFWAAYGGVFNLILLNATLGLSMYPVMQSGMFSVAGPGFMAIGAYAAALASLRLGLPLPAGILIGLAITIPLAYAIAWPLLRLRSHYFAVATIAWVECVYVVLMNWSSLTNGVLGLNHIPVTVTTWTLLVYLALLSYAMYRLSVSRVGRAFRAMRFNERVAAGLGIDVARYKALAFVLSAIPASISGAMFAHFTRVIDPTDFGFGLALNFLAFGVLGGTAVWAGPIVGAVVLTALPEILRPFGQYREVVIGCALLIAIVYFPRGLVDPLLFRRLIAARAARKLRNRTD